VRVVLDSSLARILADVDESAVVLDFGAWAKPFTRADWVIDLLPRRACVSSRA